MMKEDVIMRKTPEMKEHDVDKIFSGSVQQEYRKSWGNR